MIAAMGTGTVIVPGFLHRQNVADGSTTIEETVILVECTHIAITEAGGVFYRDKNGKDNFAMGASVQFDEVEATPYGIARPAEPENPPCEQCNSDRINIRNNFPAQRCPKCGLKA